MARKSKTRKSEEGGQVYSLLEKRVDNTPRTKAGASNWVPFGRKNDYPYTVLDLYNQSPTLDACIQFCTSALVGNGLILGDDTQSVPNYQYSWNEFIRRLAMDYFIYGSYAFQVIKNRDGMSYSFYHQPLETVRCSPRDSYGLVTSWWLCSDWTSPAQNNPVEIPSFIMRNDDEYKLKQGQPYLYVYESYTPQVSYYWLPVWASAMKAVQAEVQFMDFDLSSATNSFLPSGILSFPPASDDAEKNAIVEQVRQTFVGSSNASRLMVSFREDSEDQPVKFEKFDANLDIDLFSSANERSISRILASFNIPSRLLIGYPEQGAGFSSEGQLLETAYNVYNAIAGKHYRSIILDTINQLFRMNGLDVKLEIEDMSFGSSVQKKQETGDAGKNVDINEDNIEEQEA